MTASRPAGRSIVADILTDPLAAELDLTPWDVIVQGSQLIDPAFGDLGQALLTPDFHLGGLRTNVLRAKGPVEHRFNHPERSVFVFAAKGDFVLEIEGSGRPQLLMVQGTAAGFENGQRHLWRAQGTGPSRLRATAETVLFVSSVPRRVGVLQRREQARIIVPPDALPFGTILRHLVEVQICELDHPADDEGSVIRRCAEASLVQLIRYARARVMAQPDSPPGLANDTNLLRAWSAYLASPRHRWTLAELAAAAGLSRTVFAERFRKAFATPPLQTLRLLRLEQSKTMLRETKMTLTETAFASGYNSEAAFVRAFRRRFGLPPGRFRGQQDRQSAAPRDIF